MHWYSIEHIVNAMSDQPPPIPFEPPQPLTAVPPSGLPNDNFLSGCAMGCGTTIASVIVCALVAFTVNGKTSDYAFMSWGVVQWIGLIPLILTQRSKGYKNRVTGLIVSGCATLLASMACASMLSNMSFR
jgi:hypothetical protein